MPPSDVEDVLLTGDVVSFYAYDIAYEADLGAIEQQLRGSVEWFQLGHSKDAPRNFPSYRSLVLQMPETPVDGPLGAATVSTSARLFSVGALSVRVTIPVSYRSISELGAYRDLKLRDGTTLDGRVSEIVGRIVKVIAAHLDTPVATIGQPEAYTVFRIAPPRQAPTEGPARWPSPPSRTGSPRASATLRPFWRAKASRSDSVNKRSRKRSPIDTRTTAMT